jgi:hypothetical protein
MRIRRPHFLQEADMGIDIYLEWGGMDDESRKAQNTGFSITSGHVGYLREAYHGGPYATRILVREAFESENNAAEIPAAIMRERLTNVTEPVCAANDGHSFAQMLISAFSTAVEGDQQRRIEPATAKSDTTRPMTVEEAVVERQQKLYPEDADEMCQRVLKSFRDFVALAEQKEKETGRPCKVVASY